MERIIEFNFPARRTADARMVLAPANAHYLSGFPIVSRLKDYVIYERTADP